MNRRRVRSAPLAALLLMLGAATCVRGIKITVAPGRTDCFTETITPEVFSQIGAPRIDGRLLVSSNSQYYVPFVTAKLYGPQGHEIWKLDHIYQEAHLNVAAHAPGRYQICFTNPPDSRTEAIIDLVYFTMAHLRQGRKTAAPVVVPRGTAGERSQEVAHADHMDEVAQLAMSMNEFLQVIIGSQRYLQRKLDRHYATMKSSNHRTMGYSLLEVAVLVGIVVMQVLIITRFFDKVNLPSLSRLNV